MFEKLFTQISPYELTDNKFPIINKNNCVITTGKLGVHNSMVGNVSGFGVLLHKPICFCIFPENRYTLELIEKNLTYTISYFDKQYEKDVMFFGSKSGRNSNKMNETKLIAIETPLGNVTYQEVSWCFECKLVQGTIITEKDFINDEMKSAVLEAYKAAGVYRKYVFGEILSVWMKKNKKVNKNGR